MKELPEDLQRRWDLADANPGVAIPVGRHVVCDGCDMDFTDLPDCGGIIFESKAYGPCCAPRIIKSAEKYGEERYIKARCPPETSFADFVRAYRGPDAFIKVSSI